MTVYTSLIDSDNAQFHGGLALKHTWLSHELSKQNVGVDVEEVRLEPLVEGKLDLLIEYADVQGSYFLRVPVTRDVVNCPSQFTECMSDLLKDINTNVCTLLPMARTFRSMKGVKDITMDYDAEKVTVHLERTKNHRVFTFQWEIREIVQQWAQKHKKHDIIRRVLTHACLPWPAELFSTAPKKRMVQVPIHKHRKRRAKY